MSSTKEIGILTGGTTDHCHTFDFVYPMSQPSTLFSKSATEFFPTDVALPCPIGELHPLHPAILENQPTINIGL